jgi:hypothetical protein
MVVCEFGDCNWNACKTCIRIYLENTTTDPNCMQCHRLWSKKFMVEKLNRSFVEGDLRAAKRKILVERAISQLPETMPAAKKQRDIDEEEEKIKLLRGKGELIKLQLRETMMQIDAACLTIQRIKRGVTAESTGSGAQEVERRRFIMACPNNDCRGFLSSQYKCDLCTNFTCVDCHEMIGQSKTDPHTCDPANVESATLIKKETKPCPGCNARISKISGCDQMWCTVCHIAFSYNTGRVDTGVVHNPHFYQFQQTQQTHGAAAQPPNNNRRNGPCGTTLCSYQEFRSIMRQLETEDRRQRLTATNGENVSTLEELKKTLNELHRTINHLAGVELPDIRRRMETLINHEPVRVAYILQRVSKEEMAAKIYRDDNLRQKYLEIVNVLEVLVVVGIDSFNRMLEVATAPYTTTMTTTTTDRCLQEIENYHALRLYCNDQMKSISLTYSQSVPFINTNFALSHKRYKSAKKVKTETSTTTTETVPIPIE